MKLSIIIPVYNGEHTILDVLDSILVSIKKAYSNYKYSYEIIIIDDGSIDNTYNLVRDYLNANDYCIQIYKQRNKKQGAARNHGYKKSTGNLISFVDADDLVEKSYVIDILKEFKTSNNLDFVCFNHKREYSNYEKIMDFPKEIEKYVSKNAPKRLITPVSPVLYCFNRKFLKKNNIVFLEEVQFEDIHFTFLVFYNAKKIKKINKAIYIYKIREDSTVSPKQYLNNLDLITIFQHLNEIDLSDEEYLVLEYLAIEHLLISGSNRVIRANINKRNKNEIIDRFMNFMNKHYNGWESNIYINNKDKLKLFLIRHKLYIFLQILIKGNRIIESIRNKS